MGGLEEIPVDLRVISATNSNLESDVSSGKFRSDLFYRINVVSLVVPPLRDRDKDVILIGRKFIEDFNIKFKKHVKGFTNSAERKLLSHDWPGNVRELRNVVERAMIFAEKEYIDGDEIALTIIDAQAGSQSDGLYLQKGLTFDQVEGEYLKKILEWNNFNLESTAKQLGVTRKTLWEKRKKYGLLN